MDIKIEDRYDMYNLMRMTVIMMVLTGSITLLNFTGNKNLSNSDTKGSLLNFAPFTKQKSDNVAEQNFQHIDLTERKNPDRLF